MFVPTTASLEDIFIRVVLLFPILLYAVTTTRRYRAQTGKSIWYLVLVPVLLLLREGALLVSVGEYWQEFIVHSLSFALVFVYLEWLSSFYRSFYITLSFLLIVAAHTTIGILVGRGILPSEFQTLPFYIASILSFCYLLVHSHLAVLEGSREVEKIRGFFLAAVAAALVAHLLPALRDNAFLLRYIVPLLLCVHVLPFRAIGLVRYADTREDTNIRDLAIDKLFDFLREIGGALLSYQVIDQMLEILVDTFRDVVHADGCAALLLDEFNENLEVHALIGEYPFIKSAEDSPRPLEYATMVAVLEQGKPVFYQELTDADRERIYGSATSTQDISSLIIVPLVVENRSFGIISLVKTGKHARFSDADYNHSLILTRYASLIIENRHNYLQILEKQQIEKEVNIASGIQASLIPQHVPRYPHIDVATFTKPLRGVSGDYFDILSQEGDECISILICDVAGKGVPASLLMVMIRTAFHLLSEQGHRDEGEVISEINRLIARTTAVDLFATLSLFSYWPEKGCIRYSSGGHLPLLLYRGKEGRTERFEAMDLPIGIDETIAYETKEIAVSRGDYVVIYTDGVIETRNTHNEEYGIDRLSEEVSTRAEEQVEAKGLLDGLIQNLSEFQESMEATDDRTLVAAKFRED